ncbi:MAG: lamin tail domain-containing protein [Roseibacillus sp.]|nr:lamin tail domain-containing protein [Roseibacillus sp.]
MKLTPLLTLLLLCLILPVPAETVIAGRNSLDDNGGTDGWSGLFVMDPAITGPGGIDLGTVTTFNFWADSNRADGLHHVTPILVRRSGGDYRVHGIGTPNAPNSPGLKSVSFGLTAGSAQVDLGDGSTYHIAVLQQWEGGDDNGGGLIPFGGSGGGGMFVENTPGPNHEPAVNDAVRGDFSSGAGGRNYSFNFEIEFVSDPEAPHDILLAAGDLFPGQPAGTEIGTFTTDDLNSGDTHTYTLVSNPGGVFAIADDRLTLAATPGAAGTNHAIRVRTTDSDTLTLEKDFVLTVTAALAPSALNLSASGLNTDAPSGALVGTLSTTDGNAGDQHEYTLVPGPGDTDNGLFTIANGNELRLASPIPVGADGLGLRVRTTDLAGLWQEEAFAIAVLDPSFRINEFVASNGTGRQDEDGDFPDWIELYNEQESTLNLDGWFLTDDPDELTKWQFPPVEVSPNGYLLIVASGKDRAVAGEELHTNFELSSVGDYLALVKPDGVTIADQYAFGFQFPDVGFGYDRSGSGQGFLTPTPGVMNGSASQYGANEVTFSRERGFYDTSFNLTLSATVPGSVIRYTTNGARPSADSGTIYSSPIRISPDSGGSDRGSRIIRAVAVHASAAVQPVGTHTYLFVNGVSSPARDGVVGQTVFRSSIVNHATYSELMDDALLAQPAISIVGGLPSSGESERSVEFFTPDGSEPGFHINCGMKSVGGHSVGSPKNNFRLYFRGEYGTSKLRYDLFKDHPYSTGAADVFNRLNLRSGSHDSFFWLANPGNPGNSGGSQKGDAQYLRNRWIGDMQFAMGHESLHGRWVHVYVNGSYHGQYHLHEWPNDDFMASYLPGPPEDYEYTNGANGSKAGSDNWQATWASVKSAARVGRAAAMRWIDLENLIDYQILNYYAGNPWDWNPNQNWMAAGPGRSSSPSGGWKFFGWDSDICLQDPNANVLGKDVPDGIFRSLMGDEEFRILFRDRVYKHCFHDGVLTPIKVAQVHKFRADQIRTSIIAETARWQGGAARAPWDRDGEWQNELNRMDDYFQVRTRNLLRQLRNHSNWYPVDAPEFDIRGGFVARGFAPILTAPAGTIYYTTDGRDPRARRGTVSPTATAFTAGELIIDEATVVRARVFDGTTWSALNEAGFTLAGTQLAAAANATITEINWHPYDSESYEFIEFKNTSGATVDFTGVTLSDGVHFTFPLGSVVPPGGHIVAVEDTVAFYARYGGSGSPWYFPGIQVAGAWSGALNNGGERIVVTDAGGVPLQTITYNDAGSWPGRADGRGSSTEVENPSLVPVAQPGKDLYLDSGNNWRASSEFHGSPGRDGAGPDNRVVFNEILSNSDPPGVDVFELLNTQGSDLDIGGWFVSDDAGDFKKYRIADNTVLPAGGLRTFDESEFNNVSNAESLVPFALNGSQGDDLYLLETNAAGNLLRFVDRVEFGAAAAGESFGRWPDGSSGELYPMTNQTFGLLNESGGNAVRVGSLVIAEIHYNPDGADEGLEFITICNAGEMAENLANWKLRGEVDFDFSAATSLGAGAFLVLVDFDPTDAVALSGFQSEYGLDPLVPVLGPWTNDGAVPTRLNDGGGSVRLLRPDALVVPGDGSPAFYPMLIEDLVNYNDVPPWPLSPDGAGDSLARVAVGIYGDDPLNWEASSIPLGGVSYATWAATAFPAGTPAPDRLAEADPDGDGMSNFGEFAFVLDALNGGGSSDVLSVGPEEGGNAILVRYRTRPGTHALTYEVGVSSDLEVFDYSESALQFVSAEVLGDGAMLVSMRYPLIDPIAERLFFQIRATAN